MGRLLVIPIALLALLLAAMAWSGGGKEQRADFAFINRGDIYTLDLNQMSYMQDFRLTYGIREGLYSNDPETLKPIPAGAVGYELSDDKLAWTFHLRPACRWSNGEPVTAHDYVFSWRRLLEEPGEYTYLFYCIKNAQKYSDGLQDFYGDNPKQALPPKFDDVCVTAVDDLTLRIALDNPVAYFLELVAFPPFYPRNEKSMEPFKVVLNEKTGQYTYRNEYTRPPAVVTNGPFILKQWDFRRRLWLEKSPTYWDQEHVRSRSIEMVINENPLSQFLQYEGGWVDWMADVPVDLAPELRAKGRTDLRGSPAFGTGFLTFLCRANLPPDILDGTKNPLADARVRQALAMAIDKRFIVENVTRMGELPARTYLPPDGTLPDFRWLPGPYDQARKDPYNDKQMRTMLSANEGISSAAGPGLPYDVIRAKQLLSEAGFPDGQGFPHLPILYNTDSTARAKIVQVLKNQWKQNLNIDVDIQGIEGKVYRQRVSNKQYAIAPVAWYGDYPDAATFTDKYLSTSLQNDSDWRSDEYDQLCASAAREPDAVKRISMLSRAENMLDTQVPIVPIYHYVNTTLSRDNVHGVDPNPRALTFFKAVWVEK